MTRIHVFNIVYNYFINDGKENVYLYKSGFEWDFSIGEKLIQSKSNRLIEYCIKNIDDLYNCK